MSGHAQPVRDCILLTRPEAESRQLAQALQALDADFLVFPTLEIRPLPGDARTCARIDALDGYRLAIFVSANAVRCGLSMVRTRREWPAATRVGAIGKATARALEEAGFADVLEPESGNDSDALLAHPALQDVRGTAILVVRGVGGRDQLASTLRQRGARVDYLEAYARSRPQRDAAPLHQVVGQGRLRATVAASTEGLRNLLAMLGDEAAVALRGLPLLVHHPRIAEAAAALGFRDARVVSPEALEQVLRACLSAR